MHQVVSVQCWTGAETKALRQAMRLSIRAFAAYLGIDARTVNKWEARHTTITLRPHTQALMDTALARAPEDAKTRFIQTMSSAQQEQHAAQLAAASHDPHTEPDPGADSRTPSSGNDDPDSLLTELVQASPTSRARDDPRSDLATSAPGGNSENMIRRELLRLLRLLSMSWVLLATSCAEEQQDQSDYSSIVSGRFENVTIDDHAALNEHLWRVFVLSKSKGTVLPLVCDHLEVLIFSLNRSKGISTHRRLCALTSELLQLAGEIFFDANQYSDAAYCYTLAAAASKEADGFDLWACAMTRHAFIEMYERRFDKAAPMLELAARLARKGDGTLSTRYWVSSVQAQAFAGLGELAACQRALDAAEQVCELSGGASNGGWLRFDGSRLAEERGACYVRLRRPGLAENALGEALSQNLSARRRASVLTDLATIGLQRDDVDQLIVHAEAALEIATRTGSGFISRKLQELQGHLAPLLGDSRVRQLDQQIVAVSRNFEFR